MTVEYASGAGLEVRRAGGQLDVNCGRAKAKQIWKKIYIYGAHKGELEALSISYWVLCHRAKHTLGPGVEKASHEI